MNHSQIDFAKLSDRFQNFSEEFKTCIKLHEDQCEAFKKRVSHLEERLEAQRETLKIRTFRLTHMKQKVIKRNRTIAKLKGYIEPLHELLDRNEIFNPTSFILTEDDESESEVGSLVLTSAHDGPDRFAHHLSDDDESYDGEFDCISCLEKRLKANNERIEKERNEEINENNSASKMKTKKKKNKKLNRFSRIFSVGRC